MKTLVALSIAISVGLAFVSVPARAEDDANPCKGITKSSTSKQKQACADFQQGQ